MLFQLRKYTTKKQQSKLLFGSLILALIILSFQNCSRITAHNILDADLRLKSSGGNGEPYDGKPDYSRLVPGMTCDNKSVAIGKLEIHGDTTTLITNENSCQNISEEVPTSSLEFSSFSNRYIGHDGGIYTYIENINENIEKGIFTEAWCRAMKPDGSGSEFEFAVEWQDVGAKASLSIMSAAHPAASTSVANRQIELDRVSYDLAEGKGSLEIFLLQKIPGSKKVAGSFFGELDKTNVQAKLECLMGGQFDSVAPKFTYPGTINKTLSIGEPITDLTPIVNKSSVQFSIDAPLPSGLIFNESTGAITGSSTALAARQKYSVSALFAFGKITQQVSIGVGQSQIVDQPVSSLDSLPCSGQTSGCDLHGAIALANQISPIPLLIKIQTQNISLSGAELAVDGDISVTGALGAQTVIDAKSLSRHFDVHANAHLEIAHLKLINGKNTTGGSINALKSTLLIKDSSFQNNLADNGTDYGAGGAVYASESSLEVVNSEFVSNTSRLNGTSAGGGAIYVARNLYASVRDSNFRNNTGQEGGALTFYSSDNQLIDISNCTFDSNFALEGGAIHSLWADLSISNSRFIHNTAMLDCGAFMLYSGHRG